VEGYLQSVAIYHSRCKLGSGMWKQGAVLEGLLVGKVWPFAYAHFPEYSRGYVELFSSRYGG